MRVRVLCVLTGAGGFQRADGKLNFPILRKEKSGYLRSFVFYWATPWEILKNEPSDRSVFSHLETVDDPPKQKQKNNKKMEKRKKKSLNVPTDWRTNLLQYPVQSDIIFTSISFCSGVFWQEMLCFQFLLLPFPANFSNSLALNQRPWDWILL